MFGFTDDEDIRQNPKFAMHARAMVDMIDCAVAFLGPDLEPLVEQLKDLGQRHIAYGVKPEYLPVMGQSVLHALKNVLGSKFSKEDTKDWLTVFEMMTIHMTAGMKA